MAMQDAAGLAAMRLPRLGAKKSRCAAFCEDSNELVIVCDCGVAGHFFVISACAYYEGCDSIGVQGWHMRGAWGRAQIACIKSIWF